MPHKEGECLSATSVLDAFRSVKDKTDDLLLKNNMDTYAEEFLPRTDELAITIFCNVFEELGCRIRSSTPGSTLNKVQCPPSRQKFVNSIYKALEQKAGLIEMHGEDIIRTSTPCPDDAPEDLLEDLLDDRPGQNLELQLMGITGPGFADFLRGKTDAVQLLFGTDQGRTLMADFYAKSVLFSTILYQLSLFFEKIGGMWPKNGEPLRILEVGAGTGGTTWKLVPVLARLGIPVSYTMTDLGSSFGAAAQAKSEKYPFLEFTVLDIEKEPEAALQGTQHIVLGSNVFHATRDVSVSMANVYKLLRPGGFVVLHELTTQMLWADVSFGLFEGWWAFEDQRQHALQSPQDWAKVLKSVGFGEVDWTDGKRPEAKVQALIVALVPESSH